MAELNEIYEAIGGLKKSVEVLASESERARARDGRLFSEIEGMLRKQDTAIAQNARIEAKQESMDSRLKDAEKHVEDYKTVRKFGIAVWTATMAVAASIGYVVEHLLTWMKKA